MKRNLRAQMVGFHHPCLIFSEYQNHEYYEFLHEADEFGAAAGTYPDEREELLANSAHRYQLLVDLTTARLQLNVSFLSKSKIWFNFYSDIATHFGLGTQAYTTETRRPHVGISEITLQDHNLLQLILLHEMQHAIDFANYSGLHMSISERELRARISICEGAFVLQELEESLYANSLQDLSYWFILMFLTQGVDEGRKLDYFHLLNDDARYQLSSDGGGVVFTPLVLRSLTKELMRDKISLTSMNRYAIDKVGGKLKLHLLSLGSEDGEMSEPDNLEEMMLQDDQLAPEFLKLKNSNHDEMKDISVDYRREVLTTRNRLTDWHSYDKVYAKLKEEAKKAIERDRKSFEAVQLRLEKGAGHTLDRSLFPQIEKFTEQTLPKTPKPVPENEEQGLAGLKIPDAVQYTEAASYDEIMNGAMPVQLEPLKGLHVRHNIEEDQPTLQDHMADLSDFLKQRGGR